MRWPCVSQAAEQEAEVRWQELVQERADALEALGWRIMTHQDNGYAYYWNPETNETSWEAPQGFVLPEMYPPYADRS